MIIHSPRVLLSHEKRCLFSSPSKLVFDLNVKKWMKHDEGIRKWQSRTMSFHDVQRKKCGGKPRLLYRQKREGYSWRVNKHIKTPKLDQTLSERANDPNKNNWNLQEESVCFVGRKSRQSPLAMVRKEIIVQKCVCFGKPFKNKSDACKHWSKYWYCFKGIKTQNAIQLLFCPEESTPFWLDQIKENSILSRVVIQ